MKMFILIFLGGLTLITGGDSVQMNHLGEPVSHVVAESRCRATKSHLIDNSLNEQLLKEYMERNVLKSVWMGIRRTTLDHWAWIDGENSTSKMLNDDVASRACGGVSTVTGKLRAMDCNFGGEYKNKEGVVCEHNGSSNVDRNNCFIASGPIYTIHCGVSNWYQARDICTTHNATMAKLNTEVKIDALVKKKAGNPSIKLCGFLWIGIKKEDWFTLASKRKNSVTRTKWGPGEPVVTGDCAIATILNDRIIWSAVKCAQKHLAVCVSYPTPLEPSGNKSEITLSFTVTRKHNDVSTKTSFPLWSLILTIVTVVTIGAVFLGLLQQKWKKEREINSDSTNTGESLIESSFYPMTRTNRSGSVTFDRQLAATPLSVAGVLLEKRSVSVILDREEEPRPISLATIYSNQRHESEEGPLLADGFISSLPNRSVLATQAERGELSDDPLPSTTIDQWCRLQ